MSHLNESVIAILTGIALVTTIATSGAVASRKYNFNYSYLTPLSFSTYTYTAYLTAQESSPYTTLVATILVGVYDSIAGWDICKRC